MNSLFDVNLLQRPLTWLLRSVLVLSAFVGIMLPRAETDDPFFKAYDYCVKVSAHNASECHPRFITWFANPCNVIMVCAAQLLTSNSQSSVCR